LERTCFQSGALWSGPANLPADVAIAYGIDPSLPNRVKTWRDHGYVVHLMTGVSWGQYQDYYYGRLDGVVHEDEAQTNGAGKKIVHNGDVYYMCPTESYGKMLCAGVQRGLDAGVEAVHLEEPEYWVAAGYSEAFKREWQSYYHEAWQSPDSSPDAQWRASKLKYFLYRRALQQVFDYVQDYNRRTGRKVRCYVATHSVVNYSTFRIVSPESSLTLLDGCDGYIAQIWSDTTRRPNLYRGILKERDFETGFLEYGAMQNLVRSTGRRMWFLSDPISDLPNLSWDSYQQTWEATIIASLLQPDIWRYEIAPWPERVFGKTHPIGADPAVRTMIPPTYATRLQTVMNSLNDMNQQTVSWDCGTPGIGVVISDSMMFERGQPQPSDSVLSYFYGLAMPLVKRGMPITPVQLENVGLKGFLDPFKVLLLTYQGMKPLTPAVHTALANWVKAGGSLVVWDDDSDPYNRAREWWNTGELHFATPREHLFAQLGIDQKQMPRDATPFPIGKGSLTWVRENPVALANDAAGDARVAAVTRAAAAKIGLAWKETNSFVLRRGPYLIAAGMDESPISDLKEINGRFVNMLDADLPVLRHIKITPGSRWYLLDLDQEGNQGPSILASSGFARQITKDDTHLIIGVEGVPATPGIVLIRTAKAPRRVTLGGVVLNDVNYSGDDQLLRIHFSNTAKPQELCVQY
jgi:hypothetical protein